MSYLKVSKYGSFANAKKKFNNEIRLSKNIGTIVTAKHIFAERYTGTDGLSQFLYGGPRSYERPYNTGLL